MTDETQAGPDWAGFGYGEIAFLISQLEGAAVQRARKLFDFGDNVWSPEVLAAAASSLVARNTVTLEEDGTLSPQGEAALLSYALMSSVRWTRLGFLHHDGEIFDSGIVFHTPELTIFAQPRNLGSWIYVVQDPEVSDADALFALAEAFLTQNATGSVLVSAETLDSEANLLLTRDALGLWEVARTESPLWQASVDSDVDEQTVRAVLAAVLALG